MEMPARTRAFFMLLAVSAIWGFATPIIKIAFPYFPPILFLTYRFLISTVIMLPWLFWAEPGTWSTLGELSHRDWFWFIVSGILGSTIELTLLFFGLNLTTTLDGSIINSTSSVFVAIAGAIFLKEVITGSEIFGHLIALIGTLVIVLQPLFEGQLILKGSIWGNFLVFLGTITWVIYVVLTKKLLNHKLSPLLLTTNMFVTGFIFESLLLFLTLTPGYIGYLFSRAPVSAHLSVLYMALFSGSLAYYFYQKAQKIVDVTRANIILYAQPLFTIPLSYFWLKEPITSPFIVGCLIITAGITISETFGARRRHLV